MSELQNAIDQLDSLMGTIAEEGQKVLAQSAAVHELCDSRKEMIETDTATHAAEIASHERTISMQKDLITELETDIVNLTTYKTKFEALQGILGATPSL